MPKREIANKINQISRDSRPKYCEGRVCSPCFPFSDSQFGGCDPQDWLVKVSVQGYMYTEHLLVAFSLFGGNFNQSVQEKTTFVSQVLSFCFELLVENLLFGLLELFLLNLFILQQATCLYSHLFLTPFGTDKIFIHLMLFSSLLAESDVHFSN